MSSEPSFDPGFSTPAMDERLSSAARLTAMCAVEAALAGARSDAGLLDRGLADAITAACREPVGDPVGLLREGWRAGSPVIPLLALLRERLDPAAAAELHRGATSQDIIDTAAMLMCRDALLDLADAMVGTRRTLRALTGAHRDTPALARTFLQPAGTTTFGARAAAWLTAWDRHLSPLRQVASSLPVQLGGPVGTASGLEGRAREVTEALALRLGLAVPVMPWHSDRSVVADMAARVSLLVATAASIATDLVLLAQPEVGELRMRPGGSSSIVDKRNPYDAVHAIAAAEATGGMASVLLAPRAPELERAAGAWHVEWFAVPVMLQTASACLSALGTAVGSLEVDAQRMRANLGDRSDREALVAAGEIVDQALSADDPATRAGSA